MLLRVTTAALTVAILSLFSPALAFHPFEESSGYVMPRKFQKYQRNSSQVYEAIPKPPGMFGGMEDAPQMKKPSLGKAPPLLDGGARPSISPVAPAIVSFSGYGAGQIIIDTANRKLYYTLAGSKAYQYPIAVGRQGFTWTGTQQISRKVSWPDWRPPAEMRERKPELPELMTGGIRNPLGAMALYLGNSLYRIHGTNETKTIGTAASSGCFRMLNGHVMHLSGIAGVGTTVRVLSKLPKNVAEVTGAAKS